MKQFFSLTSSQIVHPAELNYLSIGSFQEGISVKETLEDEGSTFLLTFPFLTMSCFVFFNWGKDVVDDDDDDEGIWWLKEKG